MKINNLIIIAIILIFCFSCEDQDEIYKQYLTETVYPGKADSLRTYIGIEKVYLAWDAPTDAKAERMVVKYSETDSIISETIIDSVVVSGLDSGETYKFQVFSVDKDDNQSIKIYADLYPISNDWVSKNMFIAKPVILPTDGVNVNSLTFSWAALNNDVMKYKDGLEFTMTDAQGNALVIDPTNINNDVVGGKLSIVVPNLNEEGTYTITYKMLFSPSVDNSAILDTAPLSGELTFVPSDYSLDPIYMLVESIGWDASSFVPLAALEPGRYISQNINLKANDVIRAFHDEELTSEKQYGYSFFNTIPDFMQASDDGNDNIKLIINDGLYDVHLETTTKVVSVTGNYDGLIEIPGVVEAEFYNIGGQGYGYNDTSPDGNAGNGWRKEGVDVEGSLDAGTRSNISHTSDGEWLVYTVQVLETGTYQVDGSFGARTGSGNSVGQLAVFIDDVERTVIEVDGTGNWGSYKSNPASSDIQLEAGIHKLKFLLRSPSYNFDNVTFTKK